MSWTVTRKVAGGNSGSGVLQAGQRRSQTLTRIADHGTGCS